MASRITAQTRRWGRDLADWMEERTGIVSITGKLLYEPMPRRGRLLYTLGSATLFLITLQFLTGILLLFNYAPTTDHAWDSIYYIMTNVYFGKLIRGIHFWSANALIVVIGLHMVRTFLSGSYKRPREMNWVVGVLLIVIVTVMAFSGYALRWDQEGFWAWEVGAMIASYTPLIGNWAITALLGGDTAGPATLSRVFALHVWLLPAALAPLIGIHLYLLRKHGEFGATFEYAERLAALRKRRQMEETFGSAEEVGSGNATDTGYSERARDEQRIVEIRHAPRERVEEGEIVTKEDVFDRYDEPQGFFPGQVVVDLTVSAILLAIVVVLSYAVPAPLTEPMDVSTTVYVPRPEWFFFFLDQWLVYFPGSVLIAIGDVIVPFLFVLLLLAIPWLDKEPAHSPARRPFVVVVGFLVILVIVLNMLLTLVRIANFPGGTPAG